MGCGRRAWWVTASFAGRGRSDAPGPVSFLCVHSLDETADLHQVAGEDAVSAPRSRSVQSVQACPVEPAAGASPCTSPALLNPMSSPPYVSTVCRCAARTASLSVRSQVIARACPPATSIRRTVSRSDAPLGAATTVERSKPLRCCGRGDYGCDERARLAIATTCCVSQ